MQEKILKFSSIIVHKIPQETHQWYQSHPQFIQLCVILKFMNIHIKIDPNLFESTRPKTEPTQTLSSRPFQNCNSIHIRINMFSFKFIMKIACYCFDMILCILMIKCIIIICFVLVTTLNQVSHHGCLVIGAKQGCRCRGADVTISHEQVR